MKRNSSIRRPRRENLTKVARALNEYASIDSYLAEIDRFAQISTWISDQPDYMSFTPEQLLMLSQIEDINLTEHHS